MIVFLFVWIGLAVVAGILGQDKPMGFGGGFLWGFFLGIIGVIVVACSSGKGDSKGWTYICDECGMKLKSEVKLKKVVCKNCGHVEIYEVMTEVQKKELEELKKDQAYEKKVTDAKILEEKFRKIFTKDGQEELKSESEKKPYIFS